MKERDPTRQIPMPVKVKPYQHQVKAFEFICDKFGLASFVFMPFAGVALLMEMGTGKSLTAVATAGALYSENRIHRVLVIAPLSVVSVWDEEFSKFAEFDYNLTVLTGSCVKKSERLMQMSGNALQVAVINYESAWRMEKELATWKPDLIIADEGHKIKTHNISAAKALHRLARIPGIGCF